MMLSPVTVMSSEARQPGMAGHEPVCGWQDEIAGWQAGPELAPGELAPEQVIAWLRGPEGERWMRTRVRRIWRHGPDAGLLASVARPPGRAGCAARWPEPYSRHLL